jgi:hypothetical protein
MRKTGVAIRSDLKKHHRLFSVTTNVRTMETLVEIHQEALADLISVKLATSTTSHVRKIIAVEVALLKDQAPMQLSVSRKAKKLHNNNINNSNTFICAMHVRHKKTKPEDLIDVFLFVGRIVICQFIVTHQKPSANHITYEMRCMKHVLSKCLR